MGEDSLVPLLRELDRCLNLVTARAALTGPDSQDFAQDCRVHVLGLIRAQRLPAEVASGYLFKVIRNYYIDWRRSRIGRRRLALGVVADSAKAARDGGRLEAPTTRRPVFVSLAAVEGVAGRDSADSTLQNREARVFLESAVASIRREVSRLGRVDRALLIGRFVNGWTVRLTARLVGLPERRAYSRLAHIVCRLRHSLTETERWAVGALGSDRTSMALTFTDLGLMSADSMAVRETGRTSADCEVQCRRSPRQDQHRVG